MPPISVRPPHPQSRFRGAFLGCLLGDAIGRPFEMMTTSDARLGPSLERFLGRDEPLRYSDDSEMMIGVAESLLRCGRVDADDLLRTLAANYDITRGYGHGMRLALEASRAGQTSVAFSVWPEGSKGNGGAVRVVPVACRYHEDVPRLVAMANDATVITHAHMLGRAGGVAQALAIAYLLAQRSPRVDPAALIAAVVAPAVVADTLVSEKLVLVADLLARGASAAEAAAALGNGALADEAFPLALFCFLRWAPDFTEVVKNSVLAGGDTDTVAAMSGALAGAWAGEEALPKAWLARVEDGPRGRDHVLHLADALFDAWRLD